MRSGRDSVEEAGSKPAWFATTRWSVVLAAGQGTDAEAREALDLLCRAYWYPLYAFIRRAGHSPEDAQDLVQGFFFHLLRRDILPLADPGRGRFRSFLLGTLKHFLADEQEKAGAQKRGGGQQLISWDQAQAEARFQNEAADTSSPDRVFERRWAITILDRALERLREESSQAGRSELFDHLKGFVTGEKGAVGYAEAAGEFGMGLSAFKSAVFRLRRRYHQLVREEVSQTVAHPGEVEAELRYMLEVFTQGN